ncbi:hypothetical protein [Pseudobutyrivibrio ruminis]|uniref:hypothetical protein n=1 Tax=Pseudobutyrivibrio ruminis TaxID=46206 RepID=UPI00051B0F8A|nr:hypothetical protein [Pseudobutyrivibrio ruminis]
MAISPIMGIGSYSSISYVQPMNYAVDNDADFSDVYNTESTKQSGVVNGASPVQYPDAQIQDVDESAIQIDSLERQQKTLQVSNDYNNIAMQFSSNNTSYSMKGVGASYGMAGSRFDAYA